VQTRDDVDVFSADMRRKSHGQLTPSAAVTRRNGGGREEGGLPTRGDAQVDTFTATEDSESIGHPRRLSPRHL